MSINFSLAKASHLTKLSINNAGGKRPLREGNAKLCIKGVEI